MKIMHVFGILSILLLLAACTPGNLTATVKNTPEVKQYLENHPNANFRAVFWDVGTARLNLAQMKTDCGADMPAKEYWYVNLEDQGSNLKVYLDGKTNKPLCVYGEGISKILTPDATIDTSGNSGNTAPKSGAVKVELYVMSMCPYGTQAEAGILPGVKKLGSSVDLVLEFIGEESNGVFNSLHGQKEVDENIKHLCALDINKQKAYDFILCRNKDFNADWKNCAKTAGLDASALETCFSGDKGKALLKASFGKASAAGAQGSPTIIIGGKDYAGARSESSFTRAICNLIADKPKVCTDLPEIKPVKMIVLNDKRCAECDVADLVDSLKQMLVSLDVTNYDYSDKEGKKLYDETGIKLLPAMLFTDDVKTSESYDQISRYLEQKGKYLSLKIGANFDPTKEICDNFKDDTGDGKVDCEDKDCVGAIVCRQEKTKQLDLFIMSDCPYGKMAVLAVKKVLDNAKNAFNLDIHYIASEANGVFTSLHGDYEVTEDIRQLCVDKYYADKAFDYIFCRSSGAIKDVDYKTCAAKSGIDTAKIDACVSGAEGKSLLSEDIKIAEALQITASPTWLANNKNLFNGIDAEQIRQQFCAYNAGLTGCDVAIPTDTTTASTATASGSCG